MDLDKFIIHQESSNDEMKLFLEGELDLSTAPQLRKAAELLIDEKDKALVLNMRELKYIDSTGIGVIISILKKRENTKSSFAVEEVPPKIKKLFDLTGITKFLNPTNTNFVERTET